MTRTGNGMVWVVKSFVNDRIGIKKKNFYIEVWWRGRWVYAPHDIYLGEYCDPSRPGELWVRTVPAFPRGHWGRLSQR